MTPFDSGYWDQPSYDGNKQGSQTAEEIFLAVGRALSHWEYVEEHLSAIFALLVFQGKSSPVAVLRAFGSIESKPAKLDSLEIAAEAFFHRFWPRSEISRPFFKMKDCINKASWRRNEIAHGVVRQQARQIIKDGIPESEFKGFFLEATNYKTKQNKPLATLLDPNQPDRFRTSKYAYSATDVDTFARKFEALRLAMHFYMVSLSPSGPDGWPGPIAECLAADEAQKIEKEKRQLDRERSPANAKRKRGTRPQSTEPNPEG